MSIFYGSDSSCLSDVGQFDQQITNPNILVGQRIARILQTPRGGFGAIGDDPNRGWDCRQYINMKLTPALIALGQQQIQAECEKDEQVQSASVVFSLDAQGALQSIAINLQSAEGPFTLTANVSALTSSLFFEFSQ